ncbi:hypothetical protein [Catellatospora vulcania]|nr:hypothetical protein [Catellatospora vulcania]
MDWSAPLIMIATRLRMLHRSTLKVNGVTVDLHRAESSLIKPDNGIYSG